MRTRKATQALILGFFVYGSTKVFRGLVSPTLTKIPLPNVATASTSRQTSPQQPLARLAKSIKSPPLPKIKSPPLPKIKTTHETKPVFPRTLIPFKLHQQGATGSSFSLSMPASFDRVQLDGRMIEHVKWIDEEILVFIGKYYPQYLSLYKTLPHHIYRADLARYMLLNTFGGLYSDTV